MLMQRLVVGLVLVVLVLAVLVVFVQLGFLVVLVQLGFLVVLVQVGVLELVDVRFHELFAKLMIVLESILSCLKESEVGQV